MRFDLFLYDSIDICVSSIYMYAVRFVFVQFDLYERVLKILSVTERHTIWAADYLNVFPFQSNAGRFKSTNQRLAFRGFLAFPRENRPWETKR